MNVVFSIITGIGFGAAMFFRKVSVKQIGMFAFILEALVEAILALILIAIIFPFNISDFTSKYQGSIFAIGTGIAMAIAVLSFLLAAKYGPVIIPSVISPILGAIIASLLAVFFLKETITLGKVVGLMISLIGLFIFLKF